MAEELFPDPKAPIVAPAGATEDLQPAPNAEITAPSSTTRRVLGDGGIALAKGIIGVPEAAVGLADLVTGGRAGKVLENEGGALGFRPKQAKEYLDTLKSPEQQAADENVARAGKDGTLLDYGAALIQNPSTIAGAVLESAPSMIGGGAVARGVLKGAQAAGRAIPSLGRAAGGATAPIVAGAVGEGAVAAGQNAEQVRQEAEGGLLPEGAAPVLAASGMATGLLSFGAGRLANRLGIGDIETMLAQGRLGPSGEIIPRTAAERLVAERAAAKGIWRKVGEGFIVEGVLQETPQSAQEQAAQNIALGKPLTEGVGQAAVQGGIVGGITGGAAAGLGHFGGPAVPAEAAPAPAPLPGPFTAALGLPAPAAVGGGASPIVVDPSGQAATGAQQTALDSARIQAGQANPRPRSTDGLVETGAAIGRGYPVTDVEARPVADNPAAPLATPLAPAQTVGNTPREIAYNQASDDDRALYDSIFGAPDVQDVQAKAPNMLDAALARDVNWEIDPESETPEADFLAAMGFTEEEQQDAIEEANRQLREEAQSAAAAPARDGSGDAEAPANGPAAARAPAGDQEGRAAVGAGQTQAVGATNGSDVLATDQPPADAGAAAGAGGAGAAEARAAGVPGAVAEQGAGAGAGGDEPRAGRAARAGGGNGAAERPVAEPVGRAAEQPGGGAVVVDAGGQPDGPDGANRLGGRGRAGGAATANTGAGAGGAELTYTGPTMAEINAISDVKTVDVIREAQDMVGEDELRRRAQQKIDDYSKGGKFKVSEPMMIEATAREVVALGRRAQAAAKATRDNQPVLEQDRNGLAERRAPLEGKERWPAPLAMKGAPKELAPAQQAVVAYMNGDISRTEMLQALANSGLPYGTMGGITQRLGNDGPSIGELEHLSQGRMPPAPETQDIDAAAHEAATSPTNDLPEPTDAQKEAGNYKKGHINVQGLDISVENPKGSTRSGTREDGSTWSHEMSDHYGYVKRTTGADGEQIDVYVGPEPDAGTVYVVDQLDQRTGAFDEAKVMIGFPSEKAARAAYASNFDKGWKIGPITPMTMDQFKDWLANGDTTKPVGDVKAPKAKAPAPSPAPAPAADSKAAAQQQMRAALDQVAAVNAKWQEFYRANASWVEGDGPARKLRADAPEAVREAWGDYRVAKSEARKAIEAAQKAVREATGELAPSSPSFTQDARSEVDPVEQKADEVMRLAEEFGAKGEMKFQLTRDQVVDLIREKGMDAADKTIAGFKKAIAGLSDSPESQAKNAAAAKKRATKEDAAHLFMTPIQRELEGKSAADIAELMAQHRKAKPSALEKRYGPNPTDEQKAAHAQEMRAWESRARALKKAHGPALERDNAAFRAKQEGAEAPAAAPKKENKLQRELREAEEARSAYFTPGNVIRSYGGGFDRVVSYQPPTTPGGQWSVSVQAVTKTGPATFEDTPNERVRTHSTQPRPSELKTGPAGKMAQPTRQELKAELDALQAEANGRAPVEYLNEQQLERRRQILDQMDKAPEAPASTDPDAVAAAEADMPTPATGLAAGLPEAPESAGFDAQTEWAALVEDMSDAEVSAVYKQAKLGKAKDVTEQRKVLRAAPEATMYPVYERMVEAGTFPDEPITAEGNNAEPDWRGENDPPPAHFPAPAETVNADKLANDAGPFITPVQAKQLLAAWKKEAKRQGKEEDNSNKVIISLFDASGEISKPWREAGYDVLQYDIQLGDDLMERFPMADLLELQAMGKEVYGVIAQPPCTCFASSGARWWSERHDQHDKNMVNKMFGPKASHFFSRPKEYTRALVDMVDALIDLAKPTGFTVMENPVGRIATEMNLPAPTMRLEPHTYGDPYTKRTQLWGQFNTALPTANVEPTLGSLMHKMSSSAEKSGKRSLTPEGFAYAFFMANSKTPTIGARPAPAAVEVAQATIGTHKDPGEAPEPATAQVVQEAVATGAKAERAKPSEIRAELLKQVDAAMPNASTDDDALRQMLLAAYTVGKPSRDDTMRYWRDHPKLSMSEAEEALTKQRQKAQDAKSADAAEKIGYVTFDVPGDGTFKVVNHVERLKAFRSKVSGDKGFSDRGQERVKPREATGGTASAIQNMVEEGDYQAALDYATAKGVTLDSVKLTKPERAKLDAWLKTNPQPTTEADDVQEPAAAPADSGEWLEAMYGEVKTPAAPAAPNALELTPKQFHEAMLRNMAADTGATLAEVRENYDTEGGRAEHQRAWVDAVRQAFKDGAPLTRQTLDKLEEVRPGAVQSFAHDFPEAKLPNGYQTPAARATEKQAADEKKADRADAKRERAAADGKSRAASGGQEGVNGYFYKGGQFLPSTEAAPGKWKVNGKWVNAGTEQIEPGARAAQPTPFSRSIYSMVNAWMRQGADGAMSIIQNVRDNAGQPVTRETEIRPGVKGVLGKESLTLGELVDAYNQGQRWFDVKPDAATVTTEPAQEAPAAPIADAGEKIGGARKDRWKERGMNLDDLDSIAESEAAELVNKAAVWKPDWAKLVEDGMNPAMAATAKVVLDRLAAKPKDNTPEGRRRYVKMMQAVREVYGNLTPENVASARTRLLYDKLQWTEGRGSDTTELAKRNAQGIEDLAAHMREQRNTLFSVYKGRSDPFSFDSMDLRKVKDMIEEGFPAKGEPWKKRFSTRPRTTRGLTPRGRELLEEQSKALGTPITVEQITQGDADGAYWEVRQNATNKVVGYALNQEQADAVAKDAYAKAIAKTSGGTLENPPDRPHLDKLERTGLADRLDRDATPQDFINDFGFRGVEFGNWAAQDERQRVINMAYDGLADLAEIMGVPKEAMSLNGTMGLAFGARGGGKFAAHYEPGRLVINMTKLRGGGSMAHEWAHAFDHYMGELDMPDAYKTKARGASGWYEQERYNGMPRPRMEKDAAGKWVNVTRTRLENLRPELARAFDRVMSALFSKQVSKAEKVRDAELRVERSQARAAAEEDPRLKAMYQEGAKSAQAELERLRGLPDDTTFEGGISDYAGQAQRLNGEKANGYWTRPTEMFARAFESWVFDRLQGVGAKSDYLVHGVDADRYANPDRYKGNPYPTGAERTAINAAFNSLANSLKTREGAGGRQTLFSAQAAGEAPLTFPKLDLEPTPQQSQDVVQNTGTGQAYKPSEGIRRFKASKLKSALQAQYGTSNINFEAVEPNNVSETEAQSLQAVRSTASRLFGHDVVFVRFAPGTPPVFNGAVNDAMPGTIFINVDASRPHMAVAGHELLHQLRNYNPQLYNQLQARMAALYKQGAEQSYFDGIREAYESRGMGVPRAWKEEMLADVVGDHFMDPQFWSDIGAGMKPGPFRMLAQAVLKFIQRLRNLMTGSRPFGTDQYLADLDAARDAVVQAMAQFSAERVEHPNRAPVGMLERESDASTLLSIATDPQALQQAARRAFATTMNTPGKLNWWHKTVGSPYNLAQRSPAFKVVFDRVQDFLKDVSEYATEAADMAPSLLPKLEKTSDIWKKQPISAENSKAIARPIFEGTLSWARDDNGRPVKLEDLEKRYAATSTEDKARMMLRKDKVTEGELKSWQALPQASYEGAVNNRFEQEMLKAGVKWKDSELKSLFGLNDEQIGLYKQFRAATDKSLDTLGLSDIVRLAGKDGEGIAQAIMDSGDVMTGAEIARDYLMGLADVMDQPTQVSGEERERLLQQAAQLNAQADALEADSPSNRNVRAIETQIEQMTQEAVAIGALNPAEGDAIMRRVRLLEGRLTEAKAVAGATTNMRAKALRIEADNLKARAYPEQKRSGRGSTLLDTANQIIDKATRIQELKDQGYAPLSRFGQYSVDVVSEDGTREYFSLFESRYDADKKADELRAAFPDAKVTQGTMSKEAFKLFQGVSPETLELFGEMLGLDAQGEGAKNEAFQQYLKLTKNNRSAMKRLIQRKGIAGFSDDPARVLANFIYSNARQTSSVLHQGQIQSAVNDIPQTQGELKDAASKLASYVSDPQEEAGAFRGLLFAQYIGGSIASAMVNLTQPLQTTMPYLSQFGGIRQAAKNTRQAARDAFKPDEALKANEPDLYAALKRAEEEGTVSPQEVHQLMAQARGAATLQSGDGTRAGDLRAAAANKYEQLTFAWGKLFSTAEQYNRRLTFIAAYRTAKDNGLKGNEAFDFAEKTINETQFVANKGNRPRWARGAIGSTLFTFKSYSVNYVEMLARMAQNGPEGRKAALLALGVLFMMGGAGGLPFADDLGDLIDAVMQRLGYNFNTKQKRQELLQDLFGDAGGKFIDKGVSGLSGFPLDVSGRMGMGNLLPGTGLLTKKEDRSRDLLELLGPAGDLAKRTVQAAEQLAGGQPLKAAQSIAPRAAANLAQGIDMAQTGMYRDQKGRKVIETTPAEAALKAIGFQPTTVARVQEATGDQYNAIAQNRLRSQEISDRWAEGIAMRDAAKVKEAQDMLRDWNEKNPDTPIRPSLKAIQRKARTMMQDKAERLAKTAPKAMREEVKRELANDLR